VNATEIRETLHEVSDAVAVPRPDALSFRRAVRAQRRRRARTRTVVAAGLAAAVAAVAGLVGPQLSTPGGPDVPGGPDSPGGPAERGTVAQARTSEPVYVLVGHRLTALDPGGVRHDLGVRSEGIVGWTTERLLALDDDSHVVAFAARRHGEDPDPTWSFERVAPPVTGTVTSVRLSGDGRYLAWTDLQGSLTVRDLKAGTDRTEVVGDAASVASVSATGVLLRDDSPRYVVDDGDGPVDLPVPDASYDASSGQGGAVSVTDEHGRTLLFEVGEDHRARRVATVAGTGTLAPDGRSMAVVRQGQDDRQTVDVWRPEGTVTLPDVSGVVLDLRWQDERTLLVADGPRLWACDTVAESCGVLTTGPADATLRLRP
jgi:hypothetical protein